jgi:hypothetical protein
MALNSKWQILGAHGVWIDFTDATNSFINKELNDGTRVIVYRFSPASKEYEYSLDVTTMKQINTDTNKERKVRCVSGIPSTWTYDGKALSVDDNVILNDALAAGEQSAMNLSISKDLDINAMMAYGILVQKLVLPDPPEDPNHMCPVCYQSKNLTSMLLPCRHVLCRACARRISNINNICPLCRGIIQSVYILDKQQPVPIFTDK